MSDFLNITDFLLPLSLAEISFDQGFKKGQMGKMIKVYDEEGLPDIADADIIFVGCGEQRGSGFHKTSSEAPNTIRRQLYATHHWHNDIRLADLGNIRQGADVKDSYAALKTVVKELIKRNKTVVILGGSHDLSLAQYFSYAENKSIVEVTNVDAYVDINMESELRSDNFLMELLTSEPNFVRHYNHIAFQSYYVHPHMLETMDKLRFDCYRVGKVKENIEEMEPVLRNSQMLSFDISAIANAFAPANKESPNGLTGEEACVLFQYAGMSSTISTIGIYGYQVSDDLRELTAKQISQMIWYFIDGRSRGKKELPLTEKEAHSEYRTAFAEVETIFLHSKKTGRWWMQMPNKKFIACSHNDYLQAGNNEIPERWLRAMERH